MSSKKVRAGHRGFLASTLPEVDACLEKDAAAAKAELIKWKVTLKEQLEKILPLDEQILAELVEKEDSTEDEVTEEITRAATLKADVTQRLVAIDERLTATSNVPHPEPSTSQAVSSPPASNQNGAQNTSSPATTSGNQKTARVKLPKLEVRKFSGRLEQWQEFWDCYESAIHLNESLSDVDKFSYLRGLLLEPARSAIAGFSLTAANYAAAVELLKKRFGKKTAIQRTLVNELLNTRPVFNDSDTVRLRNLYDFVESKYRALQALQVEEQHYSEIVVPVLLKGIPDSIRLTITRGTNYLEWSVQELLAALLTEVELREDHCLSQRGSSDRRKVPVIPTANALFAKKGEIKGCAFCLGNHTPESCTKVNDIGERKKLLIRFGRCFKCISKGHRARDCEKTVQCKHCKGSHNTCLCEAKLGQTFGENNTRLVENSVNTQLVGTECRIALQTAQAIISGGSQGRIRVLFDSGSHRSFVTAKAASKYDLPVVRKEWVTISTFGQKGKESGLREVVRFDIKPLNGGRVQVLEAYVVPVISHISNEHVEVIKNDFPHLRDLWFSDVCQSKDELEIDLLVGADYLWEFQKGRTVRGEAEEPVAVETELGWVLSGPLKKRDHLENSQTSSQDVSVNFVGHDSVDLDKASLDLEISRLWDLESLGIKSQGDEVHESFENEIEFVGGRYSVKLPWKQGHDPLPNNYDNSLSRMKGQLRKLKREPDILTEYDSIIKDQLAAGVIEKVAELEEASDKVHYLPHHAVIRRDAETTKLRIVYDASSKATKNEISLNDCLHTGPSLNPLLFDILVRFRENKIALVGDIEKAFLNVAVDEKDRDSLRFLWVEDVRDHNLSIAVYRFCRVVFGLNASPFLLNGTIRHHLATFAQRDPEFVKRMLEGFYVDDLVTGEGTTDKAFTLYQKVRDRLAMGGFNLRKWKTNDPDLREKIRCSESGKTAREVKRLEDEETYAKSKLEPQGEAKGEKVLGQAWDSDNDTLHFNFAVLANKAKSLEATKRNVLSLLASLFDPLGIVSPVTVSMKILFQEICNQKLDWDENLKGETKLRWDKWVQDLTITNEIRVNRCLYDSVGAEEVTECYLHGFGDASKKAYCALIYFVYRTTDGKTHVRLLASKTRVAPLKELSIPRLELMSARILAQLMHTVKNALHSQRKLNGVKFWLDSKTALSWIQNKGEWKQFVRHRVNEILRLSNKEDWAYCSTEENPADLGSRGVLSSQLKGNQLWWCGPTWLTKQPEDWPVTTESFRTPESLIEEKKNRDRNVDRKGRRDRYQCSD